MKRKGWCKSQTYILTYSGTKLKGGICKNWKIILLPFLPVLLCSGIFLFCACGVFHCLWFFFRQHHAVILRALKTRDSHLRKGPRQRSLQQARKLSRSHPARFQLEQLTTDVLSHTHRTTQNGGSLGSFCVWQELSAAASLGCTRHVKDSPWYLFCFYSRWRLCCRERTGCPPADWTAWGFVCQLIKRGSSPAVMGRAGRTKIRGNPFGFKSNCGLVNPNGASSELTHCSISESHLCVGSETKRSQGANTHPASVHWLKMLKSVHSFWHHPWFVCLPAGWDISVAF